MYKNICPICNGDIIEFIKSKILIELDNSGKTTPELSYILKINIVTITKYLRLLQSEKKVIQLAGSFSNGGRIADIWQQVK